MSLIKLFNFKFMKQILKKSKGQLMIFLLLVPIFTFLSLLVTYSGNAVGVLDYDSLSIINFIGMYIIPVILSINLFNYIYKRASVDFINSMPINKKTIFCSNVLLGIILIVLMQVINIVGILIFSAIKPELVLFGELLWDLFVVTTVSYIFVFTATNIAMCLSGNIITQIAVTCLIVFFVPFFVNNFNNNLFDIRTGDYYIDLDGVVVNGNENIQLTKYDAFNETMPYRLIKCVFGSSNINIYNGVSIIKMIVLSIVYTIVGTILFERRKFENLGESFKDIKVHEFVKALTMFPMFAILYKVDVYENDIENILLIYALLIAYFIIYDIITSKKVKLKSSIVSIIIVFVVLNLSSWGIEKNIDNKEAKVYKMDDIVSMSMDTDNYRAYYSEILDCEITDKNLIDKVLRTNNSFVSTIKLRMNDGEELFVDRFYTSVDKIDYSKEELVNELKKNEEYKNKLNEIKNIDGQYTLYNQVKLNSDLEKEIEDYIIKFEKDDVNSYNGEIFYVNKYYYQNHRIMEELYPVDDNDLKLKVAKKYNEKIRESLSRIEEDEYVWYYMFTDESTRSVYVGNESSSWITEIILNGEEELDLNKDYVIIRMNSRGNEGEQYYITNNEELVNYYLKSIKKEDEEIYYKDTEDGLEEVTIEKVIY